MKTEMLSQSFAPPPSRNCSFHLTLHQINEVKKKNLVLSKTWHAESTRGSVFELARAEKSPLRSREIRPTC